MAGPHDPSPSDAPLNSGGASPEATSDLPLKARLSTTLYDMARDSLVKRSRIKSEPTDSDSVYRELNRIMPLNGYPRAQLEGKSRISDRDLPRSWNSVSYQQEFKLYDAGSPPPVATETCVGTDRESLTRRLRAQVLDETSSLPVRLGEGYYQVLERMHPGQRAEDLVREAHRVKRINGNRDVLRVGERFALETEETRARLLRERLAKICGADEGKDPAVPPGDGKDPVVPPGGGKDPVVPPGDGKDPVVPPGDGKDPVVPPGGGKDPVVPPGDGKDPAVPPGGGKDPIVPPGGGGDKNPVEPPDGGGKKPGPTGEGDRGLTMREAYEALRDQHDKLNGSFENVRDSQGIIGKLFDGAKNNIGASGEDRSWVDPRKWWSQVFDSDLGSEAIHKELGTEARTLDEMKKAVDANDATAFGSLYKELTHAEFDPKSRSVAALLSNQKVKAFDNSQHTGVDTTTDIAAGLVAVLALRTGKGSKGLQTMVRASLKGAGLGGVSKAGLMQVDGHYADLKRDAAVGALMGATVPIGELAGSQLSRLIGKKMGLTVTGELLTARIETQGTRFGTRLLSAATKSGTSGATFGAIESPGREIIHKIERGEAIDPTELLGLSIKGATVGFLGGTLLGGAADRVADGFKSMRPKPINNAGHTQVNGVDVPSSGVVSIDDAAKMMGADPADFANKARTNPYEAVADAAKLYDDTGLNIKKTDAMTGAPAVPEPFHKALTTVQNVDLLTADAGISLQRKVGIVQSVDDHLKANPNIIDDSYASVVNDPNYQEVVRIKRREGGQQAADAFESKFRDGFEQDLKTSTAVERVRAEKLTNEESLAITQPKTEAAYKQKAADFFKDMTDQTQRARLVSLVDDIYAKFNPEMISRRELTELLDSFAPGERELAAAILHESAPLSSDSLLRVRMQAARAEIEAATGSASPSHVYTLTPDSSGNLLGYLYRKSNSMSMSIQNIDALAESIKSGNAPNKVVIFDDLSQTVIGQADKDLLKQVPHVYVVDMGAFEKGINVIDLSRGIDHVSRKLSGLVKEAQQVSTANTGLLPLGSARMVLSGSVDDAAKGLGPNVKVIRPSDSIAAPNMVSTEALAGMSDVESIYNRFNIPKATKEEIATFLSGYAGEERELAARMLAEGAVHNSFPVMVKKAVALHARLKDSLASKGISTRDLILVSDKDPGGSTHLVSYLFGRVNGLSSENFVSARGLDRLIQSGGARNRAIAYFDDTIYSGSQTAGMLDSNISGLMPFKQIIIGSLGAYEKGVSRIGSTHLGKLGKVQVATSGMHHPFYSDKHPFFSQLGSDARWKVKNIGGSEGFGDVQGSLVWAYMYPDNNITFFGSSFPGKVLHLPGP